MSASHGATRRPRAPRRTTTPRARSWRPSLPGSCGHLLGDAHDRASRTRIARHFRFGGANCLADTLELGARVIGDVRKPGVDRIVLRVLLHEALDDPVFERMKADRAEAAARRQHLERTCEPRLDLRELVIDMNAQCLKGARCRVLAGLASRNGVRDDLGETARRRDRGCEACGDDRARDALREALLAVIANDARELAFRRACDELRRSHSRARIHPHVERTVLYEAEAARGVVELRRGHTE